MRQSFRLSVNGTVREVEVDPQTSLLHALRNQLGLTGARFGCGQALCGACFVLVDDVVVPSCDTPMWSVDGKRVVTVEGLGDDEDLHRVQEAVLEHQAAQCGYCISGMIMTAEAFLRTNPSPDEAAIRQALATNLCRCGTHVRIIRAVQLAARSAS